MADQHSTTFIDLTGQRFGLWVVLGPVRREHRKTFWLVECDCLARQWVFAGSLHDGSSTNCGCTRKAKTANRNRTHGMTDTREYVVWCGMIARCTNPQRKGWLNYGGRGIKVCQRWRNSFLAFITDMGMPPSCRHRIDRIDNNGDYEPGNCRWATVKQNCNNRRTSRFLEHDGKRLTLQEWSDCTGIEKHTLRVRIDLLNWTVAEALTTPVKHYARKRRG